MSPFHFSRRTFLTSSLWVTALHCTPGLMAELLTLTPQQMEGPFYPDNLPLDTDNDLIVINDSLTPAVGTIVYLSGSVTDIKGSPIRNALIEIWQVDNNGVYLHSKGGPRSKLDRHFQGYGKFVTDKKGRYAFRTLKPSPYAGRTPHIHVAVSINDTRILTTQCYMKGEPRNETDFILNKVKGTEARESLIIPFRSSKDSKLGELSARFDIVLGRTPND